MDAGPILLVALQIQVNCSEEAEHPEAAAPRLQEEKALQAHSPTYQKVDAG